MNPVIIGDATLYNIDCMEFMRSVPDLHFDLAIVDPPYGINAANVLSGPRRKSGKGAAMKSAFEAKDWDLAVPNADYFKELFRVSKNQIIWGANYMTENLPGSMGWVVWDKDNGTTNFSDCELAYTSFNSALRKFKYTWNGMIQGDMKNKEEKIHPTQKPVKLYEWLLLNYAKEGDAILDTHLGSGSIAVAANNLGYRLTGCELDKDYFEASTARIKAAQAQTSIFDAAPAKQEQVALL
jgi:site-specific DNA-methyltransferase (adenine-specific)